MAEQLSPETLAQLAELSRKLCILPNHSFSSAGTEIPIGTKCNCGMKTWTGKEDA